MTTETLTRIMEVLSECEMRLRDAASKKILIEVALLKAIEARSAVSLDCVLQQLQNLRAGNPAPRPRHTPPLPRRAPPPRPPQNPRPPRPPRPAESALKEKPIRTHCHQRNPGFATTLEPLSRCRWPRQSLHQNLSAGGASGFLCQKCFHHRL